jgi:hypothetical protein
LFTIANEGEWTIIFNKTWKQEELPTIKSGWCLKSESNP